MMLKETENRKPREELFIELYLKVFPSFASLVSKQGGSLEDAQDTFQEALIAYYERTSSDIDHPKNYLFAICRNLWYQKLRGEQKIEPLEDEMGGLLIAEDQTDLNTSKLLALVERAGKKCMELLKVFYYDQIPLESIAEKFGFSGKRSATVQKYKCLEKVRNTVNEKKLAYEDFFE